ncbi:MAG: SPFH domain-containing protein [Gammaproteobacteria bacterium]|nr:MAG: SPFH domain-containing protein [Gammaproteobacteria bacterium]
MLGIRYFKANPSSYVLKYRNGHAVKEGAGVAFYYFAPNTSLVSVPLESMDVPFMFREVSSDFQDITVQGQVTFRVAAPKTLAGLMNFTLKADGSGYLSDDPTKLAPRVVNAVQVQLRSLLQGKTLQDLLRQSDQLVNAVRDRLKSAAGIAALGLELMDLAILAIKPNPETARALEAQVREQILKQADDATYTRRNSAIEQERAIKENELNTEIAIETKKRQIRETQMDAERAVLEKRQQIQEQDMAGKVELEKRNEALTTLKAGNAQREADAKAYALSAIMKAVGNVDPKVLQAIMLGSTDPSTLIASAFQGLAENASKIGELNISPELLQQLTKGKTAKG